MSTLTQDIETIAGEMATQIELNGLVYTDTFKRANLIAALKPGINSTMTAVTNLLVQTITAGAPVLGSMDGGTVMRTTMLAFLELYNK